MTEIIKLPRGRPRFQPSLEQRRTVEELKFVGESDNAIASAIGIDPDTLRKHFGDELADGRAQRRAELVGILFDAARAGKVAAVAALDKMSRAATTGE